jgi:hypothetical protein
LGRVEWVEMRDVCGVGFVGMVDEYGVFGIRMALQRTGLV